MTKSWVICCEFPDEDKVVYETYDKGLLKGDLKLFKSFEEADDYARKKFSGLVYNIHER